MMSTTPFCNTAFDDQRLQSLLEQRALVDAQIQAQLASIQPSSAVPSIPQPHHEVSYQQRPQQCSLPRSLSQAGPSMTRSPSARSHHGSIALSKSLSQPSASSMSRMGSRNSNMSNQNIPFTNTVRMPPPLQTTDIRREPSTIESWQNQQDDPYYSMAQENQKQRLASRREPVRRGSNLQQVAEDPMGFGEDPAEYLARMNAPTLSLTHPPVEFSSPDALRIPTHRGPMYSPQSLTPTSASSVTLTNATTMASDMSRQSSMCNDAIGSLQMFKFNSNNSYISEPNSADDATYHTGSLQAPSFQKLLDEQNLLLSGAGGALDHSQFSTPYQTQQQLTSSNLLAATNMKRSESNESNSSTSSSQSRAKLQLQKQNQLAARPLMPKAGSDEIVYRDSSNQGGPRSKSHDGTEAKAIPISKSSTYVRPKHERVFCDRCPDLVEGFRGPHELGRHHDRVHKELVKKWVCVEPAEGTTSIRPINPLSKCKTCSQQKKKYGAYYNAAAHLRRAHFRPKPRGRGKGAKADEKTEKRGGKGGGFFPDMNELKHWMKEVYDENRLDDEQQQDDDGSEEEADCVDGSYDNETSPGMLPNNTGALSTTQSNFDNNNSMLYVDSSMIDAYPTPTSSFNGSTQGMQMMQQQVPIPLQQGVIDNMTMRYGASQAAMFDPSVLVDADLAFMDPSFSHLGDQYGPGFFDNIPYTM